MTYSFPVRLTFNFRRFSKYFFETHTVIFQRIFLKHSNFPKGNSDGISLLYHLTPEFKVGGQGTMRRNNQKSMGRLNLDTRAGLMGKDGKGDHFKLFLNSQAIHMLTLPK